MVIGIRLQNRANAGRPEVIVVLHRGSHVSRPSVLLCTHTAASRSSRRNEVRYESSSVAARADSGASCQGTEECKFTARGSDSDQRKPSKLVQVASWVLVVGTSWILSCGKARAVNLTTALAGPLFEPIREDSPRWLRTLVWNDFKLAVVFLVAVPLILWVWSLIEQKGKQDAIKRIMFGYWQAASLLMWTVYLQIGAQPLSFATAAAVQVLIPFTLWWWKDLSAEVAGDESALAKAFRWWRWIATVLAISGAATQLSQTQTACTALSDPRAVLSSPLCATWLEPPFRYKDIFHSGFAPEQLQIVGQLGTLIFVASFVLYLSTSLPRTGRLARSNKSLSYKALKKMGFYTS